MRNGLVSNRWVSRVRKSSVAAALGLAMVALGANASPAVAAEGVGSAEEIGSGRALVRIDAASATVAKKADGSYTLRIPVGSTGQFLGNRPDASGKSRLIVGQVSAKQLSKKWRNFRYTSAGVPTTLTWDSKTPKTLVGARVHLSKPSVAAKWVEFTFTTKQEVPALLKDVTVNLERAPGKSARKTYTIENTVNLSGNMNFFAGFYDAAYVDVYLMDGSRHCWSYKFNDMHTATIPNMSCAGVPQWDGTVTWKPNPTCSGCLFPSTESGVYLATNIQPSGQSAFLYNSKVINISGW